MPYILILAASLTGAIASCCLACIPGLHIYNVMGLLVIGIHWLAAHSFNIPLEITIPFSLGLMVGYALLNTIPSVILAAPDESAMFTVLPGQKYMLTGRGYEGVMITVIGGAVGLIFIVAIMGPIAPILLPQLHLVMRKHVHWILWCIIAFMLMSEWPKSRPIGQAGWSRFLDSWKSTGAGLLTFLLSGLLGFLLFFRSPVNVDVAFQSLMPAFVGLFTIPWLILNIGTGVTPPPQKITAPSNLNTQTTLKGSFAGILGGSFAAFFPIVTGGVGGLLAGHATAIRNDRAFLISQGASKQVYYVGGILLFFVPGLGVTRGGAAGMMKGLVAPLGYYEYLMALTSIALAGAFSLLLVGPLTRATLKVTTRFGYRRISSVALIFILALVVSVTGLSGLMILCVACGIGLIPVLFGSRRMNCLGIILLPMACMMSGFGPVIANFLGLL